MTTLPGEGPAVTKNRAQPGGRGQAVGDLCGRPVVKHEGKSTVAARRLFGGGEGGGGGRGGGGGGGGGGEPLPQGHSTRCERERFAAARQQHLPRRQEG